jgi:rod shape-determining protein MreC
MRFLKNKLAVTIILLSVILLTIIGFTANRNKYTFGEGKVGDTLNYVQEFMYNTFSNFKAAIGSVTHFSDIVKENKELKEKNNVLETKELMYDYLKKENDNLRDILKFENVNSQYSYKICNIINKSGDSFVEQYTIDKGSDDGLISGMTVITSQGLVGQVTTVSNKWSTVQSLINENIAVAGLVGNEDSNNGIVKGYKDGKYGKIAQITSLSLNSNIKPGDVVATAGIGYVYPRGIRIGEVIEVQEDKSKVMKSAKIKPYVDFSNINEVLVVIPNDKTFIKYDGDSMK